MPMPPSHCVNERQKRIPWGSSSISANTVAPVVVKPDTDSNRAAIGDSIVPDNRYGKAPTTPTATQAIETTAYPSRTDRSRPSSVPQYPNRPTITTRPPETRKAPASPSP